MNRRSLLNLGIQLLPTLALLDSLSRSTEDPAVCWACQQGIAHECEGHQLVRLDPSMPTERKVAGSC
ncbi:MAG: hypothetical protein HC924_00505 [Synechococcaceae cyanobacterium SM2_3_2]|nr:hypothetical protein [Synechococcaceae cyanobacterium SM2_3_2]